jgi:choline dehydrogenase-like flavoprotein
MSLMKGNLPDDRTVSLNKVYDAVIVGSGAAGGMAAHVLTSHGMNVLLLEAGRKIDTTKELKSTEWPYEPPRWDAAGQPCALPH